MAHDPTSQEQPIAISFNEFRNEEIVDFFASDNRPFCPDSDQNGRAFRSRLVGAPHFLRGTQQREKKQPSAAFQPLVQIHADETGKIFPEPRGAVECNKTNPSSATDSAEKSQPIIRVARLDEQTKQKRKKTAEPAFGKSTRPLGSLLVLGSNGSTKTNRAAKIVCDPLDKQTRKSGFFMSQRFSNPQAFRPEVRDNSILAPGKPEQSCSRNGSVSDTSKKNKSEDNTYKGMSPNDIVAFPGSQKTEDSLIDRIQEADEQLKNLVDFWPKLSDRLKETINALIEVSIRETTS